MRRLPAKVALVSSAATARANDMSNKISAETIMASVTRLNLGRTSARTRAASDLLCKLAAEREQEVRTVELVEAHHAEILRNAEDAGRWQALLKALRTRIAGPRHGTKLKIVEVCPMFGDEKDVDDITSVIDAAMRSANDG